MSSEQSWPVSWSLWTHYLISGHGGLQILTTPKSPDDQSRTCLTEVNTHSIEISERLQSLINDTRAASDESRQFYLSAKAVAMSQWDEIQRWQTLSEEERIGLEKAIATVAESSDETRSWTKMLVNTVSLWGETFQDQVGNLTRVNNTFSAYMRTYACSTTLSILPC